MKPEDFKIRKRFDGCIQIIVSGGWCLLTIDTITGNFYREPDIGKDTGFDLDSQGRIKDVVKWE